MSAQYRVDVANQPITPCGMNSLKYLGGSFNQARKVYMETKTGFSAWGTENAGYGVILSVWNGSDYVVKCQKGIMQ